MQDLVPAGPIECLPEKNLIKFYSCWKIKIACCIRAYKSSDNFEIALQLFQEYAESVVFSLIFKDLVQEMKFIPGKYTAPQWCIFLARDKSVRVCCVAFCPGRYIGMLNEKSLCKT